MNFTDEDVEIAATAIREYYLNVVELRSCQAIARAALSAVASRIPTTPASDAVREGLMADWDMNGGTTRDGYEAQIETLRTQIAKAKAALEPFVRALDSIESVDPLCPDRMAALRAAFDYYTRHLGENNDEIVERESVTVGDFRRARAVLQEISK
jgi:hypothetical protein